MSSDRSRWPECLIEVMVGIEKGSNTGSSSGDFHFRGEVGVVGKGKGAVVVSASSIESIGVTCVFSSDSSLVRCDSLLEFRYERDSLFELRFVEAFERSAYESLLVCSTIVLST